MVVSRYAWGGMRKETGGAKEKKKDTDTQTPYNPKAVQTPSRKEWFNNL